MAQAIRFLYNELREPRPHITTQYLAQIVARTFDALDTQGTTTINSTTNVTNIVAGLWTQTGTNLYPTVINGASVFVGITSWDGTGPLITPSGNIVAQGAIIVVTSAVSSSFLAINTKANVETNISSAHSGAGTDLPLSFYTAGTRWWTIDTTGSLIGGGLSRGSYGILTGRILTLGDLIITTGFTANESFGRFQLVSGQVNIESNVIGTGTVLPLTFKISVERARVRIGGSWLFGLTSSDVGDNAGWIVEQGVFGIVNATTNASALFLSVNGTTETVIHSSLSGTGTALPLSLYLNGIRRATLDTNGALLVGLFSSDGSAAGRVIASNGMGILSTSVNASFLFMSFNGTTETILHSGNTGTGTTLPMSLYVGGVRYFTLLTSGALIGGAFTTDIAPTAGMIVLTSAYFLITATTNASTFEIHAGSGVFEFISSSSGTGSIIPIRFNFGGTEVARWTTGGTLFVGLASSDFQPNNQPGAVFTTVQVGIISAATNASAFRMVNSAGLFSIQSTTSGTGTLQAITFIMGGTEAFRITTTPYIIVGLTSSDVGAASRVITVDRFVCVTAATNASSMFMGVTAGTESFLAAGSTGTGTNLPMSFYVANSTRAWTIDTGTVLIGGNLTPGSYGDLANRILTKGDIIITTGFTANESFLRTEITGSISTIESGAIGTGTTLPLAFNVAVGNEKARFKTTGDFLVGLTSTDASAGNGNIYISSIFGIVSATANAHALFLSINGATETVIHSSFTGTGSSLPLSIYVNGTRVVQFSNTGVMKHTPTTVGALPAGQDGMRAFVTDATSTTFASSAIGGGGNHVPVYFSSGISQWVIG